MRLWSAILTPPLLLAVAAGGASAAMAGPDQAGPAAKTRLVVRAHDNYSSGHYIEGAVSFLALRDRHHKLIFYRRLGVPAHLDRGLPAGRYRLHAWQRPCDGTCALLDRQADDCHAFLTVRAGRTSRRTVTFRPTRPCVIRSR